MGGEGEGVGRGGSALAAKLAERHVEVLAGVRAQFEGELARQRTRLVQLQSELERKGVAEARARLPSSSPAVGISPARSSRVGGASVAARDFVPLVHAERESGARPVGQRAANSGVNSAAGPTAAGGRLGPASARDLKALAEEGFELAARLASEAMAASSARQERGQPPIGPAGARAYSNRLDAYLHGETSASSWQQ
ncbi:hypothetical protein T492DRAFT_1021770 [Pavlovales sp. CCMP2436]|nr:hypothetical protein T492DRAFT_1021770 [Pavlovales sp. CCMP2436]